MLLSIFLSLNVLFVLCVFIWAFLTTDPYVTDIQNPVMHVPDPHAIEAASKEMKEAIQNYPEPDGDWTPEHIQEIDDILYDIAAKHGLSDVNVWTLVKSPQVSWGEDFEICVEQLGILANQYLPTGKDPEENNALIAAWSTARDKRIRDSGFDPASFCPQMVTFLRWKVASLETEIKRIENEIQQHDG